MRREFNEHLFRNVEELELSVRASNCLKTAHIQTIAQLVQKTAFRFDAMSYDKESMIPAAEASRPLCAPTSTTTPAPPPRVPLSAGELRAELTGNTFYSRPAMRQRKTSTGAAQLTESLGCHTRQRGCRSPA